MLNTKEVFSSLKNIFKSLNIIFLVIDEKNIIKESSRQIFKILGVKKNDVIGKRVDLFTDEKNFIILKKELLKLNNSPLDSIINTNIKLNLNDNNSMDFDISLFRHSNNRDNNDYFIIIKETFEYKEKLKNLKYLAYNDYLTKIPNRVLFLDRFKIFIFFIFVFRISLSHSQ